MIQNRNPSLDRTGAVACQLAGEVLLSSGGLRLPAKGWSMLPSVWPGDTLVIEKATSDALCPGDIVVFGRGPRLFAHRVVAKTSSGCEPTARAAEIVTCGDALRHPDQPVSENELLGRVSAIVRNGERIEPRRSLRLSQRAAAAVIRRSRLLVRALLRIHGVHQKFHFRNTRAVPCQS